MRSVRRSPALRSAEAEKDWRPSGATVPLARVCAVEMSEYAMPLPQPLVWMTERSTSAVKLPAMGAIQLTRPSNPCAGCVVTLPGGMMLRGESGIRRAGASHATAHH